MSSERNIDIFSAIILILSIIGLIMVIIGPFAGLYIGGGNYRYSCLDCGYSTPGDYAAQIIILILFIIQIIIALNDLLPTQFIKQEIAKFGIYIALLTLILAIIGLAAFGISYALNEWWPELGFYGSAVAGVLNTVLFYLKQKNK